MSLALDVDGVLLNWYKNACEKAGVPYTRVNDWNTRWIKDHWKDIENEEKYWRDLPVLTPPDHIAKVDLYLTSCPERWAKVRREELYDKGYPKVPVVISNRKIKYMLDHGIETLIDDKPSTVYNGYREDVTVYQFYPYYAMWEIVDPDIVITDLRRFYL